MALDVRPLTGTVGAEVFGVDLNTLSDPEFEELVAAWHRHEVLVIRNQNLSLAQQEAFTLRVGPFGDTPFVEPVDGHPNVIMVVKETHEAANFGGAWHSDWSFQPEPPSATILYAIEVPDAGGDTAFASMAKAYETLPDNLRDEVGGLIALHSATLPYGANGLYSSVKPAAMTINTSAVGDEVHRHPLVREHAATGRKSLFCNPTYTIGIEGMDDADSAKLLRQVYAHATKLEFMCRVRWQPGTLTMWDNRSVMHYAINDYEGIRREMRRTTVAGEAPIPAAATFGR